MMIDAVMYGMIPRKNTATFVSAPPENRSKNATTPPASDSFRSLIAWKSTYGTGMWEPSRKIPMMKIVKRILFRRSGTRNMFHRRESPCIGSYEPFLTAVIRGSAV